MQHEEATKRKILCVGKQGVNNRRGRQINMPSPLEHLFQSIFKQILIKIALGQDTSRPGLVGASLKKEVETWGGTHEAIHDAPSPPAPHLSFSASLFYFCL